MTTTTPPLSELLLLSPTRFFPAHNNNRTLNFHAYGHEAALFSLTFEHFSSRTQRVACVLRAGPAASKHAAPAIANCANVDLEPNALRLRLKGQEGDITSSLAREKNGDWIWILSDTPRSWGLKMSLPAYEDVLLPSYTSTSTSDSTSTSPPTQALKFKWQHTPPAPRTRASLAHPDWKLVRIVEGNGDGDGEVHAVLATTSDGSSDRGRLQFRRSFGHEWELSVVVLAGVLSERERMRWDRQAGFTKSMVLW